MEYLGEIIWYISLPVMIWVAVKFVNWNLKAFDEINASENSEAFKK
jgi:hypothetical protein